MVKSSSKYRRISLVSGPGCGKSTLCDWISHVLKKNHLEVELIQEEAKKLTYTDSKPESFDQFILFSKQIEAEDKALRKKFDLTISDTSDFLAICYANKNKMNGWNTLIPFSKIFNKKYPCLTLFLKRTIKTYNNNGRFEDANEALKVDKLVLNMMKKFNVEYIEVDPLNKLDILEKLSKKLKIELKD